MVIDVGDLNDAVSDKKEDRAVFSVDTETEKPEIGGFQEFDMEARMREVLLKQLLLFIKFLREVTFLEIPFKLVPERKNDHTLTILEVRRLPKTFL